MKNICTAALSAVFTGASLLLLPLSAQEQSIPVVLEPIPGTARSENSKPTEHYAPSSVQTQINVDVKEGTNEVHFIRDNTDPYVLTKAYRLKNANPYAVRGYLLAAISAKQINTSPAQVEALKLNDGAGLILVSAEDYRFNDIGGGETIDSLIAKLDRKDLPFVRNSPTRIYFPQSNYAANLRDMLYKVGANTNDNGFVLSPEMLTVDSELNALMISAPDWSFGHMMKMLESYDIPIPEVRISYKVIEIFAENDDKIGFDFQSWKNNDGMDFFSVGGRVRRNWSTFFTGNVDNSGLNKVEYWNFNPKWNSRYLDFLTSIGKARTVTSGVITARNRELSSTRVDYGFFYDRTDVPFTDVDPEFYYTSPNPDVNPRQALGSIMPEGVYNDVLPSIARGNYYWRMVGNLAAGLKQDTELADNITETTALLSKYQQGSKEWYAAYTKLQSLLNEAGATELLNYPYYNRDPLTGEEVGNKLSNSTPGIIYGKIQLPMVQNGFTFNLCVLPVVTGKAATLNFSMNSVSLIGWNSDGSPRSSSSSSNAAVQVGYSGKDFVIGGLRKTECVRGVAGLPFVKDLPVVGLLFSNETESIKQSELVIVAHAELSLPRSNKSDAAIMQNVGKITTGVNKGVESPIGNMFFQQLIIDTDQLK